MGSQEKNEGKIELDLETLAIKLTERALKTQSLVCGAKIYRVPEDLRQVKEGAYTPRLITIGPLHQGKEEFKKPMDDVKFYYTYYLLDRLAEGTQAEVIEKIRGKLKECATKVGECVKKAKKYYAEEVKFKDEELAEMMLFDGCFILELLYASYHETGRSTTEGGDHGNSKEEAEKRATKGGDSGNSKALSSSAHQPVNEGEDGSSGVGGCVYSFCKRHNLNLLSQASSSSVPQPNNKGEDRSSGGGIHRKDPIFGNTFTANIVKYDLLLLENQIPFFVLKKLFKLTVGKIPDHKIPGRKKLSLIEYVVSYFEDVMFPPGVKNGDCVLSISSSSNEIEQGEEMSREANGYIHILHLLHSRYLPQYQKKQRRLPVPGGRMENKKHSEINVSDLRISASDLDYAGIKLEGKKRNLFNITFEGGNFEIPVIRVHGFTEAILRNLIAFEQCCPWVSQHYFTSYAMFMDMLIDSEKDIQLLKNAEVIQNSLGTDKGVFDLFNNLCKEVAADLEDFYFIEECRQAFNFTKRNWWPMIIAYLKRTYYASPLGFIVGFCLAFVAFGMSVVQFIYNFLK